MVEVLPEAARLSWRPRVDAQRLKVQGRPWALSTAFHVVPFLVTAGLLMWAQPLAVPVALACLAHAWVIPELCYCIRVDAAHPAAGELPSGDRIAHLLLALRSDEQGFATVANLSFAGARWRLRRRMGAQMRPALDAAATGLDTASSAVG